MELKNDLLDRLDSNAPSISLEEVKERRQGVRARWPSGALAIAAAVVGVLALVVLVVNLSESDGTEVVAPSETPPTSLGTVASTQPLDVDSGTWTRLPDAPIPPRSLHSAVWTGEELVVWGGVTKGAFVSDGAAYNPETGEWRVLAESPLNGRYGHVMEMVNGEVLIFGGATEPIEEVGTGAFYNPERDEWREIAPTMRADPGEGGQIEGVWTGEELLVRTLTYGDPPDYDDAPTNVILAYDPVDDSWTQRMDTPDDLSILNPTAWTGDRWVMWGGHILWESDQILEMGYTYDPVSNRWETLRSAPITARYLHSATWTGEELVVFGGLDADGEDLADGAAYDPVNSEWRTLSPAPIEARHQHLAVWTGSDVLVVGGYAGRNPDDRMLRSAAAYDPLTDTWRTLPDYPRLPNSNNSTAVWVPGYGLAIWGISNGAYVLSP